MSDSLRDQLLKAGFSQSKSEQPRAKQQKPSHPKHRKPDRNSTATTQRIRSSKLVANRSDQDKIDSGVAQRKALKLQIKTLIEANAIKEFSGDVVYRFTLQNRIRELHISEAIRDQLVADELVITRLNGTTQIVPTHIAQQIRSLNPDWAIVTPTEASSDKSEDYVAYPIPDDLQW